MATYWENSCSFGLRCVSWYKYLIVNLVISHLGFWSVNLFLIAPFPDLCLLVPFLIFAQNADCVYTLEPPRRGDSNEYPQSMFLSKIKKNRHTPAYPSFAI